MLEIMFSAFHVPAVLPVFYHRRVEWLVFCVVVSFVLNVSDVSIVAMVIFVGSCFEMVWDIWDGTWMKSFRRKKGGANCATARHSYIERERAAQAPRPPVIPSPAPTDGEQAGANESVPENAGKCKGGHDRDQQLAFGARIRYFLNKGEHLPGGRAREGDGVLYHCGPVSHRKRAFE